MIRLRAILSTKYESGLGARRARLCAACSIPHAGFVLRVFMHNISC